METQALESPWWMRWCTPLHTLSDLPSARPPCALFPLRLPILLIFFPPRPLCHVLSFVRSRAHANSSSPGLYCSERIPIHHLYSLLSAIPLPSAFVYFQGFIVSSRSPVLLGLYSCWLQVPQPSVIPDAERALLGSNMGNQSLSCYRPPSHMANHPA
jgi:hypothetical protein